MTASLDKSKDNLKPSKDEKTWAMLCHLSGLSGMIFPLGHIVVPLIIWLIKKEELPFVEDQGREVLNFQISMTIYIITSGILCLILIGFLFLLILVIFGLIVVIIGAINANDGKPYRYPMAIRFIK